MAALYGRLQGNRGQVTRVGSANSGIESRLETWQGEIRTTLEANGDFAVYIGTKRGHGTPVLRGNVGNDGRWAELLLNGHHSYHDSVQNGEGRIARVDDVGSKEQAATITGAHMASEVQ